jgi:alpha-D-ribose 1-methylphosphonate 5-triphosphate diphosphatase
MGVSRVILRGADIVTPDRVLTDATLVVEDGRILEILFTAPPLGGEEVRWITGVMGPAFVDVHSDALEKEMHPRPSATMPTLLAIMELDRKLAGHGIATVAHAVSFREMDPEIRAHRVSEGTALAIGRAAPHCLVRHLVHARYEVTEPGAAPTVHRLLAQGRLSMLSFTDHAPGGRQFKSMADYIKYSAGIYGLDAEAMNRLAEEKWRRKREEAHRLQAVVSDLASAARSRGVVLASHDDESAEQVESARQLGVTIAEFPVSLEAVKAARAGGLRVVMGAPNVLRGRSRSGNLSALDALRMGALDVICSDYYPAAMLHTVVKLHRERLASLPEAFRLVSLHPARVLGLDGEVGSLEAGKAADLVIIGTQGDVPVIARTLRGGREIFAAGYPAAVPACVDA